jgi:hypothetical protein
MTVKLSAVCCVMKSPESPWHGNMAAQAVLSSLARLAGVSGSQYVASHGVGVLFLSEQGNQGSIVLSVSGLVTAALHGIAVVFFC